MGLEHVSLLSGRLLCSPPNRRGALRGLLVTRAEHPGQLPAPGGGRGWPSPGLLSLLAVGRGRGLEAHSLLGGEAQPVALHLHCDRGEGEGPPDASLGAEGGHSWC